MTQRTYAASFRTPNGAIRVFHVDAESWEQAEGFIEDIAATGKIDGELQLSGEVENTGQVGRA